MKHLAHQEFTENTDGIYQRMINNCVIMSRNKRWSVDKLPMTKHYIDNLPSTNDINVIVSSHVETCCLLRKRDEVDA